MTELLTFLIALLQLWFLVVEMFLWQTPRVVRAFGFSPEYARQSAPLAKNQGLYNGFLSAGLLWSLITSDAALAFQLRVFFLACVLVAGIYGSLTANRKILFAQAVPALIALSCVLIRG